MAEEKKYDTEQKTTQVANAPKVPSWTGGEFDTSLKEVEDWTRENKERESNKYQVLRDNFRNCKKKYIKSYVNKVILENVGENKTVTRIMKLMKDKYQMAK